MDREPVTPSERMKAETDQFTGGPGVAATKSQARGALFGVAVGVLLGALLGLIVGLIAFDSTRSVIIVIVSFAVAAATFGGVAAGFVNSRRKHQRTDADI